MNNLTLLAQLTAPPAVGCGDLLGCFLVILISLFVVNGWCLIKVLRFEYKNYRQRNQGRREKKNPDCKIAKPLGLNLGILGKPNLESKAGAFPLVGVHAQVCEIPENLIGAGRSKPVVLLELTSRLGNFSWRLSFFKHKSSDVAKQPNEKS